jgi:hypothetical protein
VPRLVEETSRALSAPELTVMAAPGQPEAAAELTAAPGQPAAAAELTAAAETPERPDGAENRNGSSPEPAMTYRNGNGAAR